MTNRDLGQVREIVEAVGMAVSYAYEDLVFLEHNAFLLQFTDKQQKILAHTNAEAKSDELEIPIAILQKKAGEFGMEFQKGSQYRLSQTDEENINIEFL